MIRCWGGFGAAAAGGFGGAGGFGAAAAQPAGFGAANTSGGFGYIKSKKILMLMPFILNYELVTFRVNKSAAMTSWSDLLIIATRSFLFLNFNISEIQMSGAAIPAPIGSWDPTACKPYRYRVPNLFGIPKTDISYVIKLFFSLTQYRKLVYWLYYSKFEFDF